MDRNILIEYFKDISLFFVIDPKHADKQKPQKGNRRMIHILQ